MLNHEYEDTKYCISFFLKLNVTLLNHQAQYLNHRAATLKPRRDDINLVKSTIFVI